MSKVLSYEEVDKKQLVNWIELCHDLFDEKKVKDSERGALYSVFGRLKIYVKENEARITALESRLREAEEIMMELAGEEECDDGFNVLEHPEHTCIDAERTRRARAFLAGGEQNKV